MSHIIDKIKANPKLKKWALFLLMPKNEYRPRRWVSLFLNVWRHKKGKGAIIRRRTRRDLFPMHDFNLGNYSLIEDFATLNNAVGEIHIGDRSLIGIGCVIIGPVKIGNDVMLAQHVVLSGMNHNYQNINIPPNQQSYTAQLIRIEDECWIGANAVITAGVTIGRHSVIAAGSVVTKDIPAYSLVAGNPGKIIKQYNKTTCKWEKSEGGSHFFDDDFKTNFYGKQHH